MDKKDNEQVASPATVESQAGNVESNQQQDDSMGDEEFYFAGRYLDFSCFYSIHFV